MTRPTSEFLDERDWLIREIDRLNVLLDRAEAVRKQNMAAGANLPRDNDSIDSIMRELRRRGDQLMEINELCSLRPCRIWTEEEGACPGEYDSSDGFLESVQLCPWHNALSLDLPVHHGPGYHPTLPSKPIRIDTNTPPPISVGSPWGE
jgi:hypothetical protein